MKKNLYKELGRMLLLSVGIYAALFVVLQVIEWLYEPWRGVLLQWNSPAFIVGIPASVVGTAYVLTIRNPQNYTGFIGGICMAVLLGTQFALQGNYDLTFLQIGIFIPFMVMSLITWRKKLQATEATPTTETTSKPFRPEYLHGWRQALTLTLVLLIIVADYAFTTLVLNHDAWGDRWLLKIAGALMIASSVMANFWLIYQKMDAWIWWMVYSLAGILFYVVLGNIYSIVLFLFYFVINSSAFFAWQKLRKN
ncbi:MAG: nicotinamide mononucleotide transporter [Paludibacteraceae bacterium]